MADRGGKLASPNRIWQADGARPHGREAGQQRADPSHKHDERVVRVGMGRFAGADEIARLKDEKLAVSICVEPKMRKGGCRALLRKLFKHGVWRNGADGCHPEHPGAAVAMSALGADTCVEHNV